MKPLLLLFTALLCLLFFSHGYAQVTDTSAQWTWMKGISTTEQTSTFGTQGVPDAGNTPGARQIPNGGISPGWVDASGKLWFFAGVGGPGVGYCNDIWKYDPGTNMWTWVRGINNVAGSVSYGILKTPALSNTPGIRQGATVWQDNAGNIWIFGGYGRNAGQAEARLNDLWRYNPAGDVWTWMSGSSIGSQNNNAYGASGAEDDSYTPGSRSSATGWTDAAGNLWLFGGHGRTTGSSSTESVLNDLWRYNTTTNKWAYTGGSVTTNANGVYGTKGVGVSTNYPGARVSSAAWKDAAGNFWLFGGSGIGSAASASYSSATNLDDLWKLNPATGVWTWVAGSNVVSTPAVYGTRGVGNAANTPGGRWGLASWVDVSGNFWIFGGGNGAVRYNDLWKYDVTAQTWTWMKGSSSTNVKGIYGTRETPDAGNAPGGRVSTVFWTDAGGNFWLLGGNGFGASTSQSTALSLNDLWRLAPVVVTPAQPGAYTAARPNVCEGETNVTYTVPPVTGATSYEWTYTGTGGGTLAGATTTGPTNTLSFSGPAGSGTLHVRAVNSAGSGPYRDTAVTVHALPTVSITPTGNQRICAGDSLLISSTATAGVDYQWKNGTTVVGTDATYYAKTNGSVYQLTVTDPATACSATSASVNLTVHALPAVSITPTGNQRICAGDSLLISSTATAGVNYQWKNGTTVVGTNATYYAKTNGGVYRLTVTDPVTACSATSASSVNLTVDALPTVSITPTGNQAICAGDSLLISSTATAGVNYEWKDGTTVVGTNATYHAKTNGGVYRLTVTDRATTCSATSASSVNLTVNPMPSATVSAGGPAIVCAGDSVMLTAGTGTGYSYQWKNGTTNVGSGSNVYAARTTGAYKVVVTAGGTGCADSTQAVWVVVHNPPVISLGPGDTAFCEGGIVTLEVSTADTGLTYRWKNGADTIPLAAAYFLEVNGTGVYKVIASRTQIARCEDSTNTVTVTVYPLPTPDVTWDGLTLHTMPGYAGYQWNAGSQGIAGATDSAFQPAADGGYSVTVTDSNGCTQTSAVYHVTVDVHDVAALDAQIKVYPNPARDLLYISAPAPVSAILSSMDGKVLQQQADASVLDIHDYTEGIYLLHITGQDGRTIKYVRLVKAGR